MQYFDIAGVIVYIGNVQRERSMKHNRSDSCSYARVRAIWLFDVCIMTSLLTSCCCSFD